MEIADIKKSNNNNKKNTHTYTTVDSYPLYTSTEVGRVSSLVGLHLPESF